MNILILNGSPAGEDSITLYTMLYIQRHFPEHRYQVLHVGQRIRTMEKERNDARGDGVSLFPHSYRIGDDLGKDDDA